MGALDNCYCEYPLPSRRMPPHDWQTKDFRCANDTVVIRRDGTFWRAVEIDVPNPDWVPTVYFGVGDWTFRDPPTIALWEVELTRIEQVPATVRIYSRLDDGGFAEVYFDVAGGVIVAARHHISELYRGNLWR